jgi:hypothetical protein
MDLNRVCDAFPWPEMAVSGIGGLVLGLIAGFVWGRISKSPNGGTMSASTVLTRLRESYYQWVPMAVIVIGALATVGIMLSAVATITNVRQDAEHAAENKARDQYNAKLLKCFNDFASDLAGGLPPVRKATAERDGALDAALEQLQAGFIKVGKDTFQPSDLQAIIAKFDTFQRASDDLSRARQENPYPEAPATFCNTSAAR